MRSLTPNIYTVVQAEQLHVRRYLAVCCSSVLALLIQGIPLGALLAPAGQLPAHKSQAYEAPR